LYRGGVLSENFESEIVKCVDRGLDAIGQNVKQVIYWHLENRLNIKRSEIASKPEAFIKALESMFGEGARHLEKAIIREISMTFDVPIPSDSLAEVIRAARHIFKRQQEVY